MLVLKEITVFCAHKHGPAHRTNTAAAAAAKTCSVYLNKKAKEMHRAHVTLHWINNTRKAKT